MKLTKLLSATLLSLGSAAGWAGTSDLQYPPTTSAGHDFNHAPIGQSFKALVPYVKAGIFIADQQSFTAWLNIIYGGLPPYPYAVSPSVTVNVKLLQGEGVSGAVLDSRDLTLVKPYMRFVEVDYASSGVTLVPGNKYTLLMTDISAHAYPSGVTGWVVPAVHDYSTGASLPPGPYADGKPILQGALVTNDAGIGDNAFEVLDAQSGTAVPPLLVTTSSLPSGKVGQAYTTALAASGGTPPYRWSVSGLPAGLALYTGGTISGTPTTAGTYSVGVIVTDNTGVTANANYTVAISQASQLTCTKPQAAKSSKGKGTVTAVGASHVMVGTKRIDYAGCTTVNYADYATAPAVGDAVEWEGYVQPNGNIMAKVLTFN